MTIRVLILNLSLGARNARHKSNLVDLIAALIERVEPVIVLAQEAGRVLPLAGDASSQLRDLSHYNPAFTKDYLGQVAERLKANFHLLFSPSVLQHPAKKQRTGVAPAEIWGQGNCIFLSRKSPWQAQDLWTGADMACAFVEEIQLPRPKGNYFYLGSRSSEPRVVQLIRVKFGNLHAVFGNIHLTTTDGEREGNDEIDQQARSLRASQIDEVIAAAKAHRDYTTQHIVTAQGQPDILYFLGGDFNEVHQRLTAHAGLSTAFVPLVMGPTRPGNRPSVDNAFIDTAHKSLATSTKILVNSATWHSASHPEYDTSNDDIVSEMVGNGMDHWPIVIELKIPEA
jgi:hypothetical protein